MYSSIGKEKNQYFFFIFSKKRIVFLQTQKIGERK